MGRWRRKLVTVLIIYFAGFATAIYALAPGSADKAERLTKGSSAGFSASFLKSDDFALSFRAGIEKSLELGKNTTLKLGNFLWKKYLAGGESTEQRD